MNDRQRRFAEAYAACGNAAQAAREAGYSASTARSQGQRLLTDVDIIAYIRQLQDQAATVRIASMLQVRAFWSDVLNNTNEKTADRLKASELLAKSAGAFLNMQPDTEASVARDADLDEDVFIYLPDNGRDKELQHYTDFQY